MTKRDGAKEMYAYVKAQRKRGAKLLLSCDSRHTKKETPRAGKSAVLKKTWN
jgi:hypothetical protein